MSAQKSSPEPPVPHPGARLSLILGAPCVAQLQTRGPRWWCASQEHRGFRKWSWSLWNAAMAGARGLLRLVGAWAH